MDNRKIEDLIKEINDVGFTVKYYSESNDYIQISIGSDGVNNTLSKTYLCERRNNNKNIKCYEREWFNKSYYLFDAETIEKSKIKVLKSWLNFYKKYGGKENDYE